MFSQIKKNSSVRHTGIFKNILLASGLILLPLFGTSGGCSKKEDAKIREVCFTPGGNCLRMIKKIIAEAEDEILVQAYAFTSKPIATALIKAYKKGVIIKVLVDDSQLTQKKSRLRQLVKQGIGVWIDNVKGIAHNKVIILDNKYVLTGSYNWTPPAEYHNAENLILIDHPATNKAYRDNWNQRLEGAQKLTLADFPSKLEGS